LDCGVGSLFDDQWELVDVVDCVVEYCDVGEEVVVVDFLEEVVVDFFVGYLIIDCEDWGVGFFCVV